MTTRHKWADGIIAMANGEDAEYESPEDGKWYCARINRTNPFDEPQLIWRVKPRTIKIGDMEVPAPITEAPEEGTAIFISVLSAENLYVELTWTNVSLHGKSVLSRGIAHLTASDAFQHSKALIAISGGRVE